MAVALLAGATLGASCESDDNPEEAICIIAAKGVAMLPSVHQRGEGLSEVLEFVEPALVEVCKQQLQRLFESPTSEFSFEIETPSGELPKTFSLEDLSETPTTTPPDELPTDRVGRVLPCVNTWDADLLIDMCIDGYLDP